MESALGLRLWILGCVLHRDNDSKSSQQQSQVLFTYEVLQCSHSKPWCRNCYYSHSTQEKVEEQRSNLSSVAEADSSGGRILTPGSGQAP